MTSQEALESLSKAFEAKIQHKTEFRGETTFTIAANDLREIAKFCHDELSFDYLIDITSIDNFGSPREITAQSTLRQGDGCISRGEEPRFEIVYHLYSMPHGVHLRLRLRVSEDVGAVDTISDLWPTANWHEREIYDMMGIKFTGHPDLRRILMWDGYPFFPLRKDFPLEGLPSEMPDIAFTKVTPMEGGPFVTVPSTATSKDREPRARPPEL
ncbi:MAG TPA: NADH-quinone oxidoreductase subunit C [Candidatus Udaeobacter sp.]|jgi:NADH-quinone oxidoreductase subunit C